MKSVAGGIVIGIVLTAGAALLIMWSGFFPVAASQGPDFLDPILAWTSARAIERHAASQDLGKMPADDSSIDEGLEHYAQMCVVCHGAPGSEGVDFLQLGLNPPPPDITSDRVQDFTDAEIFWIVKHGVRATGMPAFGNVEDDDALWKLVAAVRRMPKLTPEQQRLIEEHKPALGQGMQHEQAEEESGHEHTE